MFEEGVLFLAQREMLSYSDNDGRDVLRSLARRDGQDGRKQALLLDMATVHEDKAELLTQGLTAAEETLCEGVSLQGQFQPSPSSGAGGDLLQWRRLDEEV